MEFQLSYFKSWKMILWKCCTQYARKFGKLSSGHRTGQVSFHSNPKERQCQRILKLLHTCTHHTVAQRLKGLPARWETRVQSLGQEDPLEKEMATHSSILAWRIPWTEKPDRLQSTGSQSQTRLSDFTFTFTFTSLYLQNWVKICEAIVFLHWKTEFRSVIFERKHMQKVRITFFWIFCQRPHSKSQHKEVKSNI